MTRVDDRPNVEVSTSQRFWTWIDTRAAWVLVVVVGLSSLLFLINLRRAPDFNIDETYYTLAGQHVGHLNSVTFGADPIRVHPPLFFISVGAWLGLTGDLRAPVLDAIGSARYLSAIFDVALVALVGLLARAWSRDRPPADRGRLLVGALVLTAFNGFLLHFGRAVLIEPMAVAAGLLVLLVSWKLRQAPTWCYVTVIGALVGLAVLVKEPVVFLVAGPLIAALLQRDRRAFVRHAAAIAIGAIIWLTFPMWELVNGDWSQFASVQSVSIRRLVGLLHVTGLNRQGTQGGLLGSSFTDTFWRYLSGYISFAAGAFVLVIGLVRVLRRRRDPIDPGTSQLLSVGLISYVFLVYSFTLGQSNEQLTMYTVPASALLALSYSAVTEGERPKRHRLASRSFVASAMSAICLVPS